MDNEKLMEIVKLGSSINTRSETRFSQVVIVKLLEALGYDVTNDSEVGIDVPVQVGHETKKADYKISSGGACFILDSKAPLVEIEGDTHAYGQLHSYYRILYCKYGILYNGKKMILFRDDSATPLYIWRFNDDPGDLTVFETLAKDSFPGALEEFLNSQEKMIKLKRFVNDKKTQLERMILEEVSKESGLNDIDFTEDHLDISINFSPSVSEILEEPSSEALTNIVLLKSFRDYGPGTGLEFVKKHSAWGYIRISRKPDYLALYDADNHYVSKLFKVVKIEELNDTNYKEFSDNPSKEKYLQLKAEGKKIIRLGDEISITPIPMGKRNIFRGKRTTLERIKKASTTDDL